jgi:hypothetical protein
MFVSGVNLQEESNARKRFVSDLNYEGWMEYLTTTPVLVPVPGYRFVPGWLKRTLFLDFGIYVYRPTKEDVEKRDHAIQARENRDE